MRMMKTLCLQIAEEEGWQEANCDGGDDDDGDDDDEDDEDNVPTLLWELAASARWDPAKLAAGLTRRAGHAATCEHANANGATLR